MSKILFIFLLILTWILLERNFDLDRVLCCLDPEIKISGSKQYNKMVLALFLFN